MSKLHILHLEDSDHDAMLVHRLLDRCGLEFDVQRAATRAEYLVAMEQPEFDLILVDNKLPGFSGKAALEIARKKCPEVPFICVSGTADETQVVTALDAGAYDFVLKDQMWQLVSTVRRAAEAVRQERHGRAMARLVAAVQELSLARDVDTVMAVVRRAARELTAADGATFVLKEGDKCYYADEDAIGPLWKGQRFPMSACISGWAMLNRQAAVIEDIYADPRIPADAYRPTFVKSLAMVPIRTEAPIGAIGAYWARKRRPTPEEVDLLQALANTASVAVENVQLYAQLEQRVVDRTIQLQAANQELEEFSSSVSHDLRAPLRSIDWFVEALVEDTGGTLSPKTRQCLDHIREAGQRMRDLINDLLRLAQLSRAEMRKEKVDLSAMAREIGAELQETAFGRPVDFQVPDGLEAYADRGLIRVALANLLSNAWKYTSKIPQARIEFGSTPDPGGSQVYFVKDNGAGFDMTYADQLFRPFQRLHGQTEFPGTGVGLATVQRIIQRHGGSIWAEAAVDKGAIFHFTLPKGPSGG